MAQRVDPHAGSSLTFTNSDVAEILEEVISEVDAVVMTAVADVERHPELLVAATVLGDFGYTYFRHDEMYLYALAPCKLHPGPWLWVSKAREKWKVYDHNNVVVGDNLPSSIRSLLASRYWSKLTKPKEASNAA